MKVFGKEITTRQAEYLLKISKNKYIKGHGLFFSWDHNFLSPFEKLFDEQNYTYNERDLNSDGVERAVRNILKTGNPKAAFYAAAVLKDSKLRIEPYEEIIIEREDYEAQIAYLATYDTPRAQEIADCIADSGFAHYNLALIMNCPNVEDVSRNVDVVYRHGSTRELVNLAKYVKDVGMEEIRQKVLKKGDARANYLFANFIAKRYITKDGSPYCAHPESEINEIYDFYSQFKPSTREVMIAEHRKVVKDSKDVKHCYKLALNDVFDEKTGKRVFNDFAELEDIVLNSYEAEYMVKFATKVKGADTAKHIERLEEIGEIDLAQELELSLATRNFFQNN